MMDITIKFVSGAEEYLLCSDIILKKDTVIVFAYDDDKKKRALTYNWSAISNIDF